MATSFGCTKDDEDDGLEDASTTRGNVRFRNRRTFVEYAKILRIVLARWISICSQLRDEKLNEEADDLILPSNEEWRHRVYYRLVELQRECDAELVMKRAGEAELEMQCPKTETQPITITESKVEEQRNNWEWEPEVCEYASKGKTRKNRVVESTGSVTSVRGIVGSMTEACVQPGWRVNDILLAAKVLQRDSTSPAYSDEAEMRRVFGLVYDVLRYKKIFSRALTEVQFWRRNVSLKDRERIVWLLLYDMQGRKFARRGEIAAVEERENMFKAAGLMDIEKALLEAKTHLAASVSRLRIRGSALSLGEYLCALNPLNTGSVETHDELLPARLRIIEGVTWGKEAAVATGWVNSNKIPDKAEFLQEMLKLKLVHSENGDPTELEDTGYVFDSICPRMVNLHEKARETVAVSSLVRDHRFVFLEKSLCLGAAALARAIRVGRFCGPVVLTHSLAPRHTGYLAELLEDIEDAGRLLAFGAGDRCCEYETYLRDLGVTLQRCRVFSEKYSSHPAIAELERATIVLAIPPCSYTGVRDIVDLAVARGGDADLLESLTNACATEDDQDEIEQPRALLADQMSTLKYALTRPNVQFLIYEAHTILPSETTEMVQQVVDYVNRTAAEKYIRDHPTKKKAPKEGRDPSKTSKLERSNETGKDDRVSMISANISIPDSDLFEVGSIDDIYGENVSHMLDPGCFLAVIKRKEMMQFDSLFMIKVAESKGLFGDPNEQRETKRELLPLDRSSRRLSLINPRKRTKRCKIEIERIMAHTHSSLTKTMHENPVCPRHERRQAWRDNVRPQTLQSFRDVERSYNWQNQMESVNRLSVPVRAKSSRKKELREISSSSSTSVSTARSEVNAFTDGTVSRQEETSSVLINSFSIEPLIRRGLKYSDDLSSTILRSPILARALRRIPLENDVEESEEEDVNLHPKTSTWWGVSRRTSRLLRPGGSIEHARLPYSYRLEATTDRPISSSRDF